MFYQEARLRVQELPVERKPLFSRGQLEPTGLMASYLGRRYEVQEFHNSEQYDLKELPLLSRIRAFNVSHLIGQRFSASNDVELIKVFPNFLNAQFHGFKLHWHDDGYFPLARLRKYFFLHESVAAPLDRSTGQPMSLEIFGRVIRFGDADLTDPQKQQEFDLWSMNNVKDGERPALDQELVLEIETAIYSNLRHSGAGVPLYL